MFRILAVFFVALSLAQCTPRPTEVTASAVSEACAEAVRSLPDPWRFGSTEPFYPWNPHTLDELPHFTARADALGLGNAYAGSERPYVLAAVASCEPDSSHEIPSLCEQVAEAKARMRATASEQRAVTRSGMRVENFPYFTSVEDEFFGICDGAPLVEISIDRAHTCRIWLADQAGQRGLYLYVPAAAFDAIPLIASDASFLMTERFQACTYRRQSQ